MRREIGAACQKLQIERQIEKAEGRTGGRAGEVCQNGCRPSLRAVLPRGVAGTVLSKIEVLPVSIYDDQIRERAYEAIYGDLAFSELANRIDPPIHIVVDSGDVRLEGSVRNRAEKMLACSLVSSSALAGPLASECAG